MKGIKCVKVRKGSTCHYCKGRATTRDHIVPKCIIEGKYDPKITNFVPCCVVCNVKKGAKRSNCECSTCSMAWAVYGPLFKQVEFVDMFESEDEGAMTATLP